MADEISVLVVDDSALMRGLLSKMIEATPGLKVAERAMNGKFAFDKIPRTNPDIIILDLEMPQMNGLEFLKERKRRGIDIPVIILSAVADRSAGITMEALTLGACDFIQKPSDEETADLHTIKNSLMTMILGYGGKYRRNKGLKVLPADYTDLPESRPVPSVSRPASPGYSAPVTKLKWEPPSTRKPITPLRRSARTEVIAIGISTGGPDSLRLVFSALDPDLQVPILVVQHMPPGFTLEFARSLDRVCPLEVKEAEEGDVVKPGRILIAQGNKHLEVEKRALAVTVHLSDAPQVSGHRPSADVLFESVAQAYGNRALGVIMTGMGRDGAENLGHIYREGGITIGQDEASSVVYGMPRVAFELGHVMEQVPLDRMASRICAIAKESR
ncbi:chemotaxis response regulator protein-glutamate methylesterase [Spirochaetia bacterium]|nr:chemotaxis response regulator protein-glutamate methylesterase [Spirochaetia bacterium]